MPLLLQQQESNFPIISLSRMQTFLYLLFFSLLFYLATPQSLIQLLPENPTTHHVDPAGNPKNFGYGNNFVFCESWRLAVETNNAGVWNGTPECCVAFVKEYVTGVRYPSDCRMISSYSLSFAASVEIASDGKDAWIFDVDDTLLSWLPFLVQFQERKGFNETAYEEWSDSAIAKPIPASLELYKELKSLGFQIILLTSRTEALRKTTEKQLSDAGYDSWERLILRGSDDLNKTALAYKSGKRAELEDEGYRIHGSSGDQWSDLLGTPSATRSFKLPNPVYYLE